MSNRENVEGSSAPGANEPIDLTQQPEPGSGDRIIEGTTQGGARYTVTHQDRQKGTR